MDWKTEEGPCQYGAFADTLPTADLEPDVAADWEIARLNYLQHRPLADECRQTTSGESEEFSDNVSPYPPNG